MNLCKHVRILFIWADQVVNSKYTYTITTDHVHMVWYGNQHRKYRKTRI